MGLADIAFGHGARIGQYRVLSRLAVGGMAEIFLASAETVDGAPALVTLKRILPELRSQEEFSLMFMDEARISASLVHPNIARVHELIVEGDELFMAMEFIPGQSLASILRASRRRGRPVPMGFAGKVMREACLALDYAHHFRLATGEEAPVVHRDVSPANVMVTYDGAVRVIDFGVAKAIGSLPRTGGGVIKGSHGYMSPEQARGAPLDARSDIFSVGAVLHELLTGRPLFLRDSELLTFRSILRDEIPPPILRNPGVPRALSDAVMRALSRDPNGRFGSAKELAEAITASIPALLFDDGRSAELMGELFPNEVQRTQELLRLSTSRANANALSVAADALSQTSPMSTDPGAAVRSGRTEIFGPLPTGVIRLAEAPPPERTPLPKAPTPDSQQVEGATVMFVDDSRISRDFVEAHLESFGFPVLSCGTAADALAMLDERLPDLILLDVRMPDVDGYELCRLIRERCTRRPFLPIVFLSATISFEERCKGLAAGGDDFIGKPYQPEELVALVRAHMQRAGFLERLARERAGRARAKAIAAGWKLPQ